MSHIPDHVEHPAAYAEATRRRIIGNARLTFSRTYPDANEIIEYVERRGIASYQNGSPVFKDDLMGSLARALALYGKLTPKQVEAVRSNLKRDAARRAEWADKKAALDARREWLGEVGQRREFTLTVRKHLMLDVTPQFYGGPTTLHIWILEDEAQNVVVYKGDGGPFGYTQVVEDDQVYYRQPREGEQMTFVATVKEHGTRDGTRQTVIARPAVRKSKA